MWKKVCHINPSHHLSELNTGCKYCSRYIRYTGSISICHCYLFAHKKCLIKSIKPLIAPKTIYKCVICETEIAVEAEINEKFQCNLQLKEKIIVLLIVLLLVFVTCFNFLGYYDELIEKAYVYIGLVGFIVGGLTVLWKRLRKL